MKHTKFLATLALTTWMGGAAIAAQTPTPETVLATVGDHTITAGHVIAAIQTLPEQYQRLPDDVLFENVLTQLMQQSALAQSAEAAETAYMTRVLENDRRAMLASSALASIMTTMVTEEDVKALYDEKFSETEAAKEWNASHILVETPEEAGEVLALLKDGADFAETAKEKSTGPSGPNGGNLGWFSAGMMVPAFEQTVADLEVGQLSNPVQTQFGWHIVKLNDIRDKAAPTFEEAKVELRDELERIAIEGYIDATMASSAVDKADITDIDPSFIRNVDALN